MPVRESSRDEGEWACEDEGEGEGKFVCFGECEDD